MKNTVYVAGKITGEDYDQCFKKFEAIQLVLEEFGYKVANPMKLVPKDANWDEAMRILRPYLLNSEIVFFLPDWRDSRGSLIEHDLAVAYRIKIVHYKDLNTLRKAA